MLIIVSESLCEFPGYIMTCRTGNIQFSLNLGIEPACQRLHNQCLWGEGLQCFCDIQADLPLCS